MGFLGAFLDAQASGQRFQQNQDELDLRRQDLQQRQQYQNNLIEDGKLARVMNILKLGGRPVNDNSVHYQMDAPARLAGVPGFMPEIQVSRPAVPGQTVTANGSQFEMPTLDDLMGRERMQKQRLGEMDLGFYGIKQRIDDASRVAAAMQLLDYKNSPENRPQAPRTVKYSSPGINKETGESVLNLVFEDGTVEQRPTGVFDRNFILGIRRPATGQGRNASASTRTPKPTVTEKADAFIKQVMDESDAKGGTRPEDYVRNVDRFYTDVPASVKARARTYFRQMKSNGSGIGNQPSVPASQPRQQAPASSGSAPTAINRKTGQRMVLKDGKWQPL